MFLPPAAVCPVMPAGNLAGFAAELGIEADPLSAFVSVDRAATAAPDLAADAPATTEPTTVATGTGALIPVVTRGFGVASGSSAAAAPPTSEGATSDAPASAQDTTGLVAAAGVLLQAALLDDSTFAADISAANPQAQTVAPTEGLEGEIVGHCAAASGPGADTCTTWWHQEGLAIGLELTGPVATFDTGMETISSMVPVEIGRAQV